MNPDLFILAGIVALAFTVEACAGFGATVVTVVLASQFRPVEDVLAVFVPLNLLVSLTLVARTHPHVDRAVLLRRILPWMGGGMVAGMGVAARAAGQGWLKIVFAGLVVVLAVLQLRVLLRHGGEGARPLSSAARGMALASAGVIHGIFATGGPLAVYVLGRDLADKARFRATLSALWLILNTVLVARYVDRGVIHADTLVESTWLLVPMMLGLLAGESLHHRINEHRFRVGVYVLLLVAASVSLLRALLAS